MAVKSVGTYEFEPKDTVDKFPAPLLYVGWDDHKMFCAPHCIPVPADTPFGEWVKNALPGMYGAHPDFEKIDWDQVQWLTSGGQAFEPDMSKSMAENGLGHKSLVRFRTPGLKGLSGTSF